MAEWLKAAVLKTVEAQASVGSNPTPSAMRARTLAELIVVTLFLAACGGDQLVETQIGPVVVQHPRDWTFHEYHFSASFFDVIGYLTSGPFDADSICQFTSNSSTCHFEGPVPEPGGVSVLWEHWIPPVEVYTPQPGEEPTTIGVYPGYVAEFPNGDPTVIRWVLPYPDDLGGWLLITAHTRDSYTQALRGQLDAMIESLRLRPPPAEESSS